MHFARTDVRSAQAVATAGAYRAGSQRRNRVSKKTTESPERDRPMELIRRQSPLHILIESCRLADSRNKSHQTSLGFQTTSRSVRSQFELFDEPRRGEVQRAKTGIIQTTRPMADRHPSRAQADPMHRELAFPEQSPERERLWPTVFRG